MSRIGLRWRPMPVLLSAFVAGGLLWSGWAWRALQRSRRTLAEARAEIRAGRHGHAARKLAALLARQHRTDEVDYLLGSCEEALGRTRAAAEAWARVPPGSPFARRAIRGRMELAIGRGLFTDGERLITDAMNDPRVDGSGLPLVLGLLYSHQGRFEDARRLIEVSWDRLDRSGDGASEAPSNTLTCTSGSGSSRSPLTRSARSSSAVRTGRRKTIGSGWPWPIWRSAPALTARQPGGSMPAFGDAPTMSRSGTPGSIGRWRRTSSRRRPGRHRISRRGWRPGSSCNGWRPGQPRGEAMSRASGGRCNG